MGCIHNNSKTIVSIDVTTDCPKRREGKACKYCYVEAARDMKYNAKKIIDYSAYQGEILRFTAGKIEKLNAVGGVRLFSFGDYMVEHKNDIESILNDALAVGLKVKVITKQPLFVETFGNHPAINIIHVSIDNIGDGVAWSKALELKADYDKVKIRCAVMKPSDLEELPECDIYTFNHAAGLAKYGYRKFPKKDVKAYSENGLTAGKVCCSTGTCSTCPLKCAV